MKPTASAPNAREKHLAAIIDAHERAANATAERDRRILAAVGDGVSQADIGRAVGLTRGRVTQIVASARTLDLISGTRPVRTRNRLISEALGAGTVTQRDVARATAMPLNEVRALKDAG